ncbi:MAG: glycosyltransferase family 2 protein [Anaerolineae bacterium]|nr:glycosyltransferase family 2 protein [Anaerolineae bacterium]
MVDLSIIIVNWNVADLLDACLRSITASPVRLMAAADEAPDAPGSLLRVEVIVVDSASTDHSLAVLARYPAVQVLALEENVGFTRGNNLALRQARGRYILLLNPDTEVLGGALAQMVAYLEAHPDVGIVGPHTLNTDGTHQSTRRQFPTLVTALFESTWLERFAPPGVLRRYTLADAPDDGVVDAGWMQGSALMARREVFDEIGGLDEGFVMYSEEMDWCKRAADAGWRRVYLGTARIVHHGGKSSDQVVAQRHIYFQASKVRYFHKHFGPRTAELLRLYLLTLYGWQLGLEWVKGALGHKRDLRRERVAAYREVLRSGLRTER